jgi:glycopeptide antibiotics resistance protein
MGIYIEKEILFIFLIPIWIVIRVISFLLKNRTRNRFSLSREIIINIFFMYILCLMSITLFPLYINFHRDYNWISVNLIPVMSTLKEVTNITNDPDMHNFMVKFWIKNIGGNLLLLLPIGVMMPILWSKFNSLFKTTFFAFFLSLSIEILQLLSSYIGNVGRAFDIDDILLNSVGAIIGFIFYKIILKNKRTNL